MEAVTQQYEVYYCICTVSYILFQEPYDPQVHEHLIMEWIASCDQPFKEVEWEEFHQMLSYGHHLGQVHVPLADAIQQHILQMGDDTIADLQTMIAVRASGIAEHSSTLMIELQGYPG
jgi:hypothetical protein